MMMKLSMAALAALLLATGVAMAKEKVRPDLSGWLGEWSASEEQFITITEVRQGLSLEGSATWGAGDPERVERGGVNVGEFSAVVPYGWIDGDTLWFAMGSERTLRGDEAEEYDCTVRATLVGETIEVEDNMMCGGMNVTFSGVYGRE